MTSYKPAFTSQFKKAYKKVLKDARYDAADFEAVMRLLLADEPLVPAYRDHALANRKPERELHIKPDWLLIYKYDGEYVKFIETGSHSELFG